MSQIVHESVGDDGMTEDEYYTFNSIPLIVDRTMFANVAIAHPSHEVPVMDLKIVLPDETLSLEYVVDPIVHEGFMSDDPWYTDYDFRIPKEHVVDGTEFEIHIDPEDLLDEPNEDDKFIEFSFTSPRVEFFDGELGEMEIKFIAIEVEGRDTAVVDADLADYLATSARDFFTIQSTTHTIGEPYEYEADEWDPVTALQELDTLRIENGDTHVIYHGLYLTADGESCGNAYLTGYTSISSASDGCISYEAFPHELGHNLSLRHPAGCGAPDPDFSYPYAGGQLETGFGGWLMERLVQRTGLNQVQQPYDLMAYCGQDYRFISRYHFEKSRDYWVDETAAMPETVSLPSAVTKSTTGLLLAESIDTNGAWEVDIARPMPSENVKPTRKATGYKIDVIESGSGMSLLGSAVNVLEIGDGEDNERHWNVTLAIPRSAGDLSYSVIDMTGDVVLRGDLPDLISQ